MRGPKGKGLKRDRSVWPVPTVNATLAAKLGVESGCYGQAIVYRGSSEALRACGAVPEGFALPGEEGCNRKTMRTGRLADGRQIRVYLYLGLYSIRLGVPDETEQARTQHIETEREDANRRELDDLLFRIECFPRSAADFKQRTLHIVWEKISTPFRLLKGELIPGCRIDDESVEDIVQQCSELYWRLAEAHFSVDRRALYELQAQACRRDSQFQRFMSTVLKPSKQRRTRAKQ